jgi:RHS repeat-associated protein
VIAQFSAALGALVLLTDAHGSTRAVADAAAQVQQEYLYDAYGTLLNMQPANALTSLLYSGEQFNPVAGLQYLRARWYDPSTGRFTRMDPFSGNVQDPLGLHKYTYANGDPVMGVDPSGLAEFSLAGMLCVAGIAASLGAIALPAIRGAYSQAYHVTALGTRESIFTALFYGEVTWDDFERMVSGFGGGAGAGAMDLLDTLTFRQVDAIHDYRDQLWKAEGLQDSWVGSLANGFAWAGTGLLYSAALVYGWSALEGPTMDIAVKKTGDFPKLLHFRYGVDGVWRHAVGPMAGYMWIRATTALETELQITGIPVLSTKAVMTDASQAYNCATAVLRALFRGWGGW